MSDTAVENTPPDFEITTFRSDIDGAAVVEVGTVDVHGRVRVYVNDGTVYDADPEVAAPRSRVTDAVLAALDAVDGRTPDADVDDYLAALRTLTVTPPAAPKPPLFVVPTPSTTEAPR